MLKSILTAAVLASPVMLGATAQASTISPDNSGFQFADPSVSSSFTDVYDFTLSQAGTVNASLSGTPNTLKISDFGIYSGTMELTTFQSLGVGNNVFAGTDSVPLGVGDYTLHVAGSVASGSAKYNGNVYVSSVPLPSTAGLFGLSLLTVGGFGAIRASRQGKAQARAV